VAESLHQAVPLEDFARQVFMAMGASETVAAAVAGHLLRANLSGHDSHGLIRIAQYVEEADRGELVPSANAEVVMEKGAVGLVDAGRGFGHSATALAMEWAAQRATEFGIAAAAVRRANHIGRLGEYAEIAAGRGVIGIATVGLVGGGGVTPFGGRQRYLGTNPWAIGVPAEGDPMIFDAATSGVAEGKLRVARSKRASVPEGVIVDSAGSPTVSPDDYYEGGAMLPLGGALLGHKGYGLALASALIGSLAMIDDDGASTAGTSKTTAGSAWLAGVFVLAIDPEWFGGAERYRTAVGRALAELRRQPAAAGVAEVLVPGDPERRSRALREREGIPIADAVWSDLVEVGSRYGVLLPLG
jgi:hydroxycarboxylate dehydrogenase B